MINVLIVEDSLTTREYLKQIIDSDPQLNVVGEARDGNEAVLLAAQKRPDVIIMDIQMPGMNGYEATRAIMEKWPVPIVIHSLLVAPDQTENIFQAMRAGAVAVSQKPAGVGHPTSRATVEKLIHTVKLMSEVRVVRRLKPKKNRPLLEIPKKSGSDAEIIAIGASTGGPPVLYKILSNLSKNHSIPIVVTQHIASGFLEGMVAWLSRGTDLTLKIPRTGEPIKEGCAYFAPEDHNIEITPARSLLIQKNDNSMGLKRPISHLFSSIARTYGKNAVGILLTGMGNDGALGLKEMKSNGAVTIVQDRESSVVFGMPAEAIKLSAATYVLPPSEIVSFLNAACQKNRNQDMKQV